jgi:REP-associated tyrosine transposase
MDVFFGDEDRRAYLELLGEMGEKHGVAYWGYCLMSNPVHVIAVPEREDSLALALGWAHHAYTRRINFREGWRGYLWQGRFFSCPLDERHAERALLDVERNPVRAGLVERAEDWPWSSARAHATGKADGLVAPESFLASADDWRLRLRDGMGEEETQLLRERTRTGRPLGSPKFVERLERLLLRPLQRRKPGPKPKATRSREKVRGVR